MECLYTEQRMKQVKLILVCFFLIIICGCNIHDKSLSNISTEYTVTDEVGRVIYFNEKPNRIVSLTYGTDEILIELVGLNRIAAFSKWAGNEEITFVTKEQTEIVGKKVEENIEDIVSIKPDLVIASTSTSQDLIDMMNAIGLKVYVASSPHSYDGMKKKIIGIAEAVGEKEKGNKVIYSMDNRLAKIKNKLDAIDENHKKTVIAFNFTGAMGRQNDLFDNMLNIANIRNGAVIGGLVNKGQILSKEQIIKVNPDIFLLPTWNFDNKHDAEMYYSQFLNDPAYKNLNAIKNKQIKFVSDKYRYTASHHIVDAIEVLAYSIYPEVF